MAKTPRRRKELKGKPVVGTGAIEIPYRLYLPNTYPKQKTDSNWHSIFVPTPKKKKTA